MRLLAGMRLNMNNTVVSNNAKQTLAMVVAMDRNGLIGAGNGLPWRLPDDMQWFVQQTMGKPIIMGRKTYESIPAKFRPLKGRHNIVLTRDRNYEAPGATVVHSVEEALVAAGDVEEIIIGGGANLYAQLLPQTNRIYLTLIEADLEGDAYFPPIQAIAWRKTFTQHHPTDERHNFAFTWLILERNK